MHTSGNAVPSVLCRVDPTQIFACEFWMEMSSEQISEAAAITVEVWSTVISMDVQVNRETAAQTVHPLVV